MTTRIHTGKSAKKSRGLSLVEIIFYVIILVILLMTATNLFFSMRNAYQQMRYSSAMLNSGLMAMERMERAIRNSYQIDRINSQFGNSQGKLSLITKENGSDQTIQFVLDANQALLLRQGASIDTLADVGALTDPSVQVASLIFKSVYSAKSEAVKIELTLTSTNPFITKSDKYYSTVRLGGSK